MPIKLDLNRAPYWADFDPNDDYYRILFKPSVSVQMRELNNLQAILQAQVERFGDNIFKRGTVISGCNFQFYTPYPYIKLPDSQISGAVTVPADYLGKFVKDEATGLRAYVVNYVDGYELSDPDLKTLYVQYTNSGDSGNTYQFTPGNTVTVYDGSDGLYSFNIISGGSGYANNDTLVLSPSLVLNVAFGSISPSDNLIDPLTGMNVEVVAVNTSILSGKVVVDVRPRDDDLTNGAVNSTAWSATLYNIITNPARDFSATVEQVWGQDASGRIITDAIGSVNQVILNSRGKNYRRPPQVHIKTANSSATTLTLNIEARNYISKMQLPSGVGTVGNGYAFGVGEGIIYQTGHFLRVEPQTIIVEKYSTQPNNVAVGFLTREEIIDATQDERLYENALGSPNKFGPGADRLKLTPTLTLTTKEAAAIDDEFFTLVEWNDGNPYKQNRVTQYSRIGDTIGESVYDSTGNFVMDAFQVTTESTANTQNEARFYTLTVDPGQAYIGGRKVQTLTNYKIDVTKGLDTKTSNNIISLNYGNYIRVNQLGGNFDFSTGDTITLYTVACQFLSNSSLYALGTIAPRGRAIGTARIRSMELEYGTPGTPDAVYRIYLFDIALNPGENFRDARSIYYNDTYDGIADMILTYDASSGANIATVNETKFNSLLFSAGVESLKNSNNSTYTYRTSAEANVGISNGHITISLADASEYFAVTGELSGSQLQQLIVVPTEDDLVSANLTGTVSVNTTSNTVTGTSTEFLSAFAVGDYIEVANSSAQSLRRITAIANNTVMQVDAAFSVANTSAGLRRAFPKNVPVPFGIRSGLSANVDIATGKVLKIAFGYANGEAITFDNANSTIVCQVAYDVERRDVSSATKTAVRNKYIKLRLANNTGNTSGPWCVGVPDAFRMRAVYVGNSSVSANSSEVTADFYLDHNQTSNYRGLGYLYLNPRSALSLSSNDYLLVCLDYFTNDNQGYYDTRSYLRTSAAANIAIIDSYSFDELRQSDSACSWEVPEIYTYNNDYYDLLNQIDFRPSCDATATPHADPASAPVNPTETVSFSTLSKFPKPNSVMRTQVEHYLGRVDDVYIGESSNIYLLKGIPDVNPRGRYQSNHPKDSLKLQVINVPPYPNLPRNVRSGVAAILQTNIGNEKYMNLRLKTRQVSPILTQTSLQISQPMVYTMEDIGNLERRIKDLEYYVSLSLLETSITNKIIPSSLDPSLGRFKFGFFADDFSTDMYSDVNNPQYAASIEVEGDVDFGFAGSPLEESSSAASDSNPLSTTIPQPTKLIQKATNRLVPPKYVWSLRHFTENLFFIDNGIIEQLNATKTSNPCVLSDDELSTTVSNGYFTSINKYQSKLYFEDVPGIVTLYFHIYKGASNTGAKVTVYDSNNQVVVSSNNATAVKNLTAADLTFLSTSDFAVQYYDAIQRDATTNTLTRSANNQYAIGAGKFELSVPVGGMYTIVVDTLDGQPNYKLFASFPSINNSERAVVNDPACNPQPPVYAGTIEPGRLNIQQWSCSNAFRVNATGYKAFYLNVYGLKPNTEHKFYMDAEYWQHVYLMDTAKFKEVINKNSKFTNREAPSFIEERGTDVLSLSKSRGYNEVHTLFKKAMGRLYNEDGSPTDYTRLRTDSTGYMRFLVFFPLEIAGWFSQDFNAPSYRLDYSGHGNENNVTSIAPKIKVPNVYGQMLTPTYGSSGYTTIEIRDETGQSIAKRVFANRTPSKTIPFDAKGNI